MQKYDKIYVPKINGTFEVGDKWGNHCAMTEEHKNVIVLTVEEAKELWNAAQDRANALQMGDPGDTKIFEAYMQSKGINIEG